MGFPVVPPTIYYNNTFIYNDTVKLYNLPYAISRPCVNMQTLINNNNNNNNRKILISMTHLSMRDTKVLCSSRARQRRNWKPVNIVNEETKSKNEHKQKIQMFSSRFKRHTRQCQMKKSERETSQRPKT